MGELKGEFSLLWTCIYMVVITWVTSLVYRVLYNLYLHPLRHIPGPRLAAATYLYQTYYGLHAGKSRYYLEVEKMHKKYGPVVRITPDEVQLSDPEVYDTIHSVGSKFAKSAPFYSALGAGYSTFTAAPNAMHKPRRARLDPFFSKRKVLSLEYLVQKRAQRLLEIIREKFAKNQEVDLHHAFRSISVDVISDYAFGESYELLGREDLGKEFFDLTGGIGPTWWVFQQWPAIQAFALATPPEIAKKMSKPLKQVLELMEQSRQQVLVVQDKLRRGEKLERPVIFETLLTPAEGYTVPTPDQIKDESYAILNAASDTTGNAMTVATYNVVKSPEIYRKLSEELKAAFPDEGEELSYLKLEKLPYLTGVIKEGLRLSFGVPGRLPRVVPEPGITINNQFLPAGSIASTSQWMIHRNAAYFPTPMKFSPERWLDPKEARRLDKAFVPFGKGTRGCAGINLAYSELYLTLGTLFRHYGEGKLVGNELSEEDLTYNDYFSAQNALDAKKFGVSAGRGV